MGMYTELYLCCNIKKDLPEDVLAVLQYLFDQGPEPKLLPFHPYFVTERWDHIGNSSSYYFVPRFVRDFKWNSLEEGYCLTIRCDLKNYDREIERFLAWIHPYIEATPEDHLGHIRYEEDPKPTLIYYGKDCLILEVPK
jgi:hypothetical protein